VKRDPSRQLGSHRTLPRSFLAVGGGAVIDPIDRPTLRVLAFSLGSAVENCPQRVGEPWRLEFRRGLEILRAGNFGQAAEHFARAHRLAPERAEVCYALGRERLRAGRVEEAESLLRAAWETNPNLLSAASALARCLGLYLSRYDEAEQVLGAAARRAGDVGTDRAVLEVVRAELALEQNRFLDARTAAETALSLCAPESITHDAACAALARLENQRGVELAEASQLEAALFAFKRAADLDPEWGGPVVNIGATFATMGRPRAARIAYQRALEIDPDNPVAHANLGRLCLEEGDFDSAVPLLRRAVRIAPAEPDTWVALAAALEGSGDRIGAEDSLRQALDLDHEHPEASARLADILVRAGRYREAAALVERARNALGRRGST
jgi:Flp pilus assembly protein TadD